MPLSERRSAWDLSLGGRILITYWGLPGFSPDWLSGRANSPGQSTCPVVVTFDDNSPSKFCDYPRRGTVTLHALSAVDLELVSAGNMAIDGLELLAEAKPRLFRSERKGMLPRQFRMSVPRYPWSLAFKVFTGAPDEVDRWWAERDTSSPETFKQYKARQLVTEYNDLATPVPKPKTIPPITGPGVQGRRLFGGQHE